MLSLRVMAGPPPREITRTVLPPTRKPSDRPSGEKKGLVPPSVPPIGTGRSLSCSRSQIRPPPSPGPTYATRFPSAVMATLMLPLTLGCSASLDRRKRL